MSNADVAATLTLAWVNLRGERSDYSSAVSNEDYVWYRYKAYLTRLNNYEDTDVNTTEVTEKGVATS